MNLGGHDIGFLSQMQLSWILIIFLATLIVLMLLVIIVNRIFLIIIELHYSSCKNEIKDLLDQVVAMQMTNEIDTLSIPDEMMGKLTDYAGNSAFLAQFIIDHQLRLMCNIKGNSAKILIKVYNDLNLWTYGFKKLTRSNWTEVVKGIRELATMKQYRAVRSINGFLSHYHPEVRLEAQIAIMNLTGEGTVPGYYNRHHELTRWQMIKTYGQLKKLNLKTIPNFGDYFKHPRNSVVIFSIRMAAKFGQLEALHNLGKLLDHQSESICIEAVNAIKHMEGFQMSGRVISLLIKTNSNKVKKASLECLADIGDPIISLPIIKLFMMRHKQIVIARAATRAYLQISSVKSFNDPNFNSRTKALLSHYSHKLIM